MDAPSRRSFRDGEMGSAVSRKVTTDGLQASLPHQAGQPHPASYEQPLNRSHGDVVRGCDLLQAQVRVLQVSIDIGLDFMPEELSHVLGAGLIILQDYAGQQCFTGRGLVVPRCRCGHSHGGAGTDELCQHRPGPGCGRPRVRPRFVNGRTWRAQGR